VIERIEEVRPELQLHSFTQGSGLLQAQVPVVLIRTFDLANSAIAEVSSYSIVSNYGVIAEIKT
jgi:hypothetical protein